ncbi:MAG: ABC transporter permease [Thomasclavelia sp.]
MTTGLVLGLSAVNVYVHDTEYIIQFIIIMLFYATPLLYPLQKYFQVAIRWVLNLNPFTQIVNAYRDLLCTIQALPSLTSIIYMY